MNDVRALDALQPGQLVPFGGDRVAAVSPELAAAFTAGDRLVVVQDSGALLHISAAEHALVAEAVTTAAEAFAALASVTDDQISRFYEAFGASLADDEAFGPIAAANAEDVASAAGRGRSTTRLVLTESMRRNMIEGLLTWRDADPRRDRAIETVVHEGWRVEARQAPLGVVGFVFEGRPNVFADATGVLRTGNTAVMRIGSDALRTASAIVRHALRPALTAASLPEGAVVLIESASRATGWALFDDRRVALAVARGSGEAVAQLGAVARQAGVPVSLHGTGGAWLVASSTADATHFHDAVLHSLDRKVCNTLNVCCVVADRAEDLVPIFIEALRSAGESRSGSARLHVEADSVKYVPPQLFEEKVIVARADQSGTEPFASIVSVEQLATEWEWESAPEVTLVIVADVAVAVDLFNTHSPRLTASLISADEAEQQMFYGHCEAPFIGDGFTRWVDGQFALNRPELGLSNWEHGRLFARSAVLSGDSVFTVRLAASVDDFGLHR